MQNTSLMEKRLFKASISVMALLVAAALSLFIAPMAYALDEAATDEAEKPVAATLQTSQTDGNASGDESQEAEKAESAGDDEPAEALATARITLLGNVYEMTCVDGSWETGAITLADVEGSYALAAGQDVSLRGSDGSELASVSADEEFFLAYVGAGEPPANLEVALEAVAATTPEDTPAETADDTASEQTEDEQASSGEAASALEEEAASGATAASGSSNGSSSSGSSASRNSGNSKKHSESGSKPSSKRAPSKSGASSRASRLPGSAAGAHPASARGHAHSASRSHGGSARPANGKASMKSKTAAHGPDSVSADETGAQAIGGVLKDGGRKTEAESSRPKSNEDGASAEAPAPEESERENRAGGIALLSSAVAALGAGGAVAYRRRVTE